MMIVNIDVLRRARLVLRQVNCCGRVKQRYIAVCNLSPRSTQLGYPWVGIVPVKANRHHAMHYSLVCLSVVLQCNERNSAPARALGSEVEVGNLGFPFPRESSANGNGHGVIQKRKQE